MVDTDKLSRISDYLKSVWLSNNVEYEYLTSRELHKFTFTGPGHKQAFYESHTYLSDHGIDVILTDMDTRKVEGILLSTNNSNEYYLGYNSNGAVTFSIVEK